MHWKEAGFKFSPTTSGMSYNDDNDDGSGDAWEKRTGTLEL